MYELAFEVLPSDRNGRPWPVVRTRPRRMHRVCPSTVQVVAGKSVPCVRACVRARVGPWARVRSRSPCAAVHTLPCIGMLARGDGGG
jgi:hypothetical protein